MQTRRGRTLLGSGDAITYQILASLRRRGLRNRNWMRLKSEQKALFQCALWVAKLRGRISNMKLIAQIAAIALKLTAGYRNHILSVGRRRAAALQAAFGKPNGLFTRIPRLREWLADPNYIMYLGILEANG
jgi:hypothetical protein